MPRSRPLLRLAVALTLVQLVCGKGSESKQSGAEESSEDEEYEEFKKGEKKTGQQHKFWIPTYQGTNPLNRRKISITTSEIQKYDNSIDVSLSGVNKNKTYQHERRKKYENVSEMPHLWSGENATINERYVESLDSGGITLEDSEPKRSKKKARLPSSEYSQDASDSSRSAAKKGVKAKHKKTLRERIQPTTKKYVEKAIVNQFFDELGKVGDYDAEKTPEYYRQLVQTATKNTKDKLGYKKIPKPVKPVRNAEPEIIAVNIDSKSFEKTRKEDEITFNTRHDQLGPPTGAKPGTKTSKAKNIQVKMNDTQNLEDKKDKTQKQSSISDNSDDTYDSEAEDEAESEYESEESWDNEKRTDETDSFTSFCDYSAWSDVLSRNRTERKSKLRKPKTAKMTHTVAPSDIRKWPGNDIKRKANELRKKEGKATRKEKRERQVKKRKSANQKERNTKRYKNEMDYNYDDDYPKKKLRMRTKGEKQHAVKEVTSYLKEMDKKYGGIPGGERHGRRGRERDDGYERRDTGWGRDRTKGRDRRRGRDDRDEDRWDDRGRDIDRGRWDDRGRDRDRGRWDDRAARGDRRDERGTWGRGDRRDDRGGGGRDRGGWGRGGGGDRGRGRGGDRGWGGGRGGGGGRGRGRGGDRGRGGRRGGRGDGRRGGGRGDGRRGGGRGGGRGRRRD